MPKFEIIKIHIHKNGRLFGFGVSPSDDWEILAVVFFILTLIVSMLGAYMFVMINNGQIFVIEKPTALTENTIDQGLLKQTVEYYQNRALSFKAIKTGLSEVPDPSISLVFPAGIEPASKP